MGGKRWHRIDDDDAEPATRSGALCGYASAPQVPEVKAAGLAASLAHTLRHHASMDPSNVYSSTGHNPPEGDVAELVASLTDALKDLRTSEEMCSSRFHNLGDARATLEARENAAKASELRAELGEQHAATLELEAQLLQGRAALFSPAGLRQEQAEFHAQQEMTALRAELEKQEALKDFEQEQVVRQLRAELQAHQANRIALEARRECFTNQSIAEMHEELAQEAARFVHSREASVLQHREELAMIAEHDRKRTAEANVAKSEAQRERERRFGLPNRAMKSSSAKGNYLANTTAELSAKERPSQHVQMEACVDAPLSHITQDAINELKRAVSELHAKLKDQGDPKVAVDGVATAQPKAKGQAKGKAKAKPKAKGKANAKVKG